MSDTKPKGDRFATINYWMMHGFQEYGLEPKERLVWLVLWRSATPNGDVKKVSFRRMAHETGLAERTCKRAMKSLLNQGVVKLVHRGNQHGYTNVYQIQVMEKQRKTQAEGVLEASDTVTHPSDIEG